MGAIITESCILCFMCVDECVTEAIVYAYSGCEPFMYFQDLVVIQDECVCCGACDAVCPVCAIDMNDCGYNSGGGGGGTDYGDDGEWDDNSDIEGGGGGGSSVIQPRTYTPLSGDKFLKVGLSTTMATQLPNTCVTSIMEYINHELCGGSTNEGVYISDYYNTYNDFIPNTGVSLINIFSFVSNHFVTDIFSGYIYAIDHGMMVMADIESNITGSSHNVVVVGYHPDGTLIYMDPEQGCFQEASASLLGINYAIPIRSCK